MNSLNSLKSSALNKSQREADLRYLVAQIDAQLDALADYADSRDLTDEQIEALEGRLLNEREALFF